MKYSLSEIAGIVSGEIFGDPGLEIKAFSIDSRTTSVQPGMLFIALKGERHDAHRYIPELSEKGIKAFLVSSKKAIKDNKGLSSFILVDDSLRAFQVLAAHHRRKFTSPVIGVTGSNGKTIVKEWIYQGLRKDRPLFRSPRSYNSQVGVPLSVLMLEDIYDLAVLEAGISEIGEMEKLAEMISPDIGIITNIGEAHQENFPDTGTKLREKLKLFKKAKTVIYCRDYENIHSELGSMYGKKKKFLSWGKHPDSNFRLTGIQHNNAGIRVEVEGKISFNFQIPFHDNASLENAMHFAVLLYELEYSPGFITKALLNLEPVEMRLEILKGIHSCTIISDTYNSDMVSLNNAIDLLLQQNQHKKRTVILSDILQSGRKDADLYAEVARMIREKSIDRFIGIGSALSANQGLFPANSYFFIDTDEFLSSPVLFNCHDEAILIKGARVYGFERITRELQLKTHQTTMEINLNAIVRNFNFYKSLLDPETKIMAMVKAFSYGSGSFEIANLLQFHKVDYLAVAFADEGYDLRINGIRTPIMVMNPDKSSFRTITDNMLEPEIYNFMGLRDFTAFLHASSIKNYPVHIKFDTGMHRLGFVENETGELAGLLKDESLNVVSAFSHLAASDEPEHDEFTLEQISTFTRTGEKLKQLLGKDFMMHILNSSGIERFARYQMDMVRLGIGLYGVSVNNPSRLTEASTFRTIISQVRELGPGVTVGYGRKGKIDEKRLIATLPVGYADGIPRAVGNGRGNFLVNGNVVPTVGSICMDMCMVDVTGIKVREGDEVIIFGAEHSVRKFAAAAETIPYEILSRISGRVKRIYYQE